jgi:hypothetical protein
MKVMEAVIAQGLFLPVKLLFCELSLGIPPFQDVK